MSEKRKTALDVLIAARKLINVPDKWTKGAYARARTEVLYEWEVNRKDATCYCADGAIKVAAGRAKRAREAAERVLVSANNLNAHGSYAGAIWDWNDARRRTHEEVIAGFNRAISSLRAKSRSTQ